VRQDWVMSPISFDAPGFRVFQPCTQELWVGRCTSPLRLRRTLPPTLTLLSCIGTPALGARRVRFAL
jgi:hypothetical protein